MKAYIITFDPHFANVPSVHEAITKSPLISEWWHYFSGTFIVTSAHSVSVLDIDIKTRWPDGWYIISELKQPVQGLLSKDAWDWINTRVKS